MSGKTGAMSDNDSEESKRASKKRKASRACDRCNVQHQPCDNATPKCGVCERVGAECTYDRPIRKRGPRAGYTAQFGERLWGLVLRENPEIEDMVLRILREKHGNTDMTNADFFRDNDRHSELVKRFNDSRIGKFVKNGELASSPATEPSQTAKLVDLQGTGEPISKSTSTKPNGRVTPTKNGDKSSPKTSIPGAASLPAFPNPYGAPQNPRDIYTQSDDVTKFVNEDIQRVLSSTEPGTIQRREARFSRDSTRALDWQICPLTVNTPRVYNSFTPANRLSTTYNNQPVGQAHGLSQGPSRFSATPNIPLTHANRVDLDFDIADTNQWYDSIPTDTLLNLGFTAGEGMTQDFLNFCENPDPVDNSAMPLNDQNEDEETVWRRLVMRGRFV